MSIKQVKKSQVAVLDLFISAIMFGILVTFVMFTWNSYNVKIVKQIDSNSDLIKAYHVSDLLVKYKGRPTAWHTTDLETPVVTTLGLAESEGVLDYDKVNAFINNLSYDYTRDKLGVNNYDYYIRILHIDGSDFSPVLEKGVVNTSKETTIALRRYVIYDDEEAIIELRLQR